MDQGEHARELVERAQAGDRGAFDELVRSLAAPLLASIRRRIGPALRERLEPDDVLQETLLRAFRSIGSFRWQGAGSPRRWLEGISAHLIVDEARRLGLRTTFRIDRDPLARDASPSRRVRREERFARLKKSLDDLCPEYRRVVRLSRMEGLKIAEIAERLGQTPSSVRNLLFRAMRELRESFGDTESLGLPGRALDEDETSHDD